MATDIVHLEPAITIMMTDQRRSPGAAPENPLNSLRNLSETKGIKLKLNLEENLREVEATFDLKTGGSNES